MNGEVLAAITMSFPGETPTISPTSVAPEQSSCFTSIRRWMTQRANYIPTNMEECYIEMIGVKTGYQNNGIGTAMLECVEQFARQAGANRLTIHTSGPRLRNYFERFGFTTDHTDRSALWKWLVERQTIDKLMKNLSLDQDNDYTANSYINESIVESMEE
jgi:RimJ/RimL family protein N-acetyltransferase